MELKQKILNLSDIEKMSISELLEVSDVLTGNLKESVTLINNNKKPTSGVFLLYTKCDTLLFVGVACGMREVLHQVLNKNHSPTKHFVEHVDHIRVIFTRYERELRDKLIPELKPMFNGGRGPNNSLKTYGYESFKERREEAEYNFDELLREWKVLMNINNDDKSCNDTPQTKQPVLSFEEAFNMSADDLLKKSIFLKKDLDNIIKQLDEIGCDSGVYLMYTQCDTLLYVGQSFHLKDRLKTHLRGHSSNTNNYIDYVSYLRVIFIDESTYELLKIEEKIIRALKPMFNGGKGRVRYGYGYESFYERLFEAKENFHKLLSEWKDRLKTYNVKSLPNKKQRVGEKSMKIKLSDVLPYLNKFSKMEFVINQIIANAEEMYGEEDGSIISEVLADVLAEISKTKGKISVA